MEYAEYLQSPQWQETRRRFWASRYPKRCHACSRDDVPLDLHHRTYKRLGRERLSDLILLCRSCHDETHVVARGRTRSGGLYSSHRVVKRRKRRRHP